jgi:Fe-Mn family superoxide dismutase
MTRRLGFEYNGMILHEYYFANMRPAAGPRPPRGSALANALGDAFGSMELWEAAFQSVAAMRGVGWVILFQDGVTRRLSNHWISVHQNGVPAGFKPLLVMDVWEHAFMRDYRATHRMLYVDAFFRNIAWPIVEHRLEEDIAIRPAAVA